LEPQPGDRLCFITETWSKLSSVSHKGNTHLDTEENNMIGPMMLLWCIVGASVS